MSLPVADRCGLQSPFTAVHHIALITKDMQRTVEFYRDVLGSEVAMTHRMPREANERHYFITVAPNTVFAFFEFPDADMPGYLPPTQSKSGRALDHIAFFVEDEASLKQWHGRLQGKVDNLTNIRDLDIVLAFFFSDPNGIVLEVMAEKTMNFPLYLDPDPVAGSPAT